MKAAWFSRTLIANFLAIVIQFVAGDSIGLTSEAKLYILAALNMLLRFLTTRPVTVNPAKVT